MLGTLEKAARILDLFTPARPEWWVSEVARTLSVPTSSAHLTRSSLDQTGLLHRPLAGRYRLGFKLLSLCQTLLTNTPWRDVAHEEMARLAQRSGENVGLAAFDGGQVVPVDGCAGRLGGAGAPGGRDSAGSRPWKVGSVFVRAGMCGVAAPVRNHNGEVIATLSMGTTAARFERQKELQREVLHSAAEISGRIGYSAGMPRG